MKINIQIKSASKKDVGIIKNEIEIEDNICSAGELIESIVKYMIKNNSSEECMFESDNVFRTLQSFFEVKKVPSLSDAINIALNAFDDRLFAMFIDDVRYFNKNDKINLTGGETLTFIKLTMLTGCIF